MSPDNQIALLTTLSASEYKQFRKALRLLTGVGIDLFTATGMLLSAIESKRMRNRQ